MGALLLCSGGLDSTTVGYWLVEKRISFQPVFFDYGQHCVEKEWETVKKVLPFSDLVSPVLRVDISPIYQHSTSRLIAEPIYGRRTSRTMSFTSPTARFCSFP